MKTNDPLGVAKSALLDECNAHIATNAKLVASQAEADQLRAEVLALKQERELAVQQMADVARRSEQDLLSARESERRLLGRMKTATSPLVKSIGRCSHCGERAPLMLRTQEQVDAEIVRIVRKDRSSANSRAFGMADDAVSNLDRLCREPTSGPSGVDVSASSPRAEPATGATYLPLSERVRCIRSESEAQETGDYRYCRECLSKPCRWWNGWRPSGPGSASATKESADNAGAPAGAAKTREPERVTGSFMCMQCGRENEYHRDACRSCGAERPVTETQPDPAADRDCNCDQAVELARVVKECRRLALEIVVATEGATATD